MGKSEKKDRCDRSFGVPEKKSTGYYNRRTIINNVCINNMIEKSRCI